MKAVTLQAEGARTLTLAQLITRLLLPFSAAYFLSYLYRTVNAVLAPEIAGSIALDAADIGLMTGAYFLAFGAFQLPLGLLLDRFGPRRVEAGLLMFAAAGALTFSLAENAGTLVLGRALIGLGVSACLMAALKAIVQWVPQPRWPLMNGIVLFSGGMGAVAATAPVQAALALVDWRGVYAILAAVTVAAAVFLFLTVPDRDAGGESPSLAAQMREVRRILVHPLFLRIAPVTMVSLGAFMAIQGLWAGPWLRDVARLGADGAAAGLTVMAAGTAAGYLLMGAVAARLALRGIPTVVVAAAGLAVFWCAGGAMALGWTGAPIFLSAVYGFFGASSSLNYAVLTQGFEPHLAGRVNTSVNLCIFAAAFTTQWGLGAIIGLWPKQAAGGWPPEAFMVAFAVPVVLQAAAFLWFMPAATRSARQ
ncbi:MAG: MFS transporter [Solirubrobacterales bacterium]